MIDNIVNFFIVHAAIVLPLAVVLALLVSSTARAAFRMLARIMARLLLFAAVVALAHDGVSTLSGASGFVMTSIWEHWAGVSPTTLEAAHVAVSKSLDPVIWEMALTPLLRLPAWIVAGALALIFSLIGRRRTQVGIFVN